MIAYPLWVLRWVRWAAREGLRRLRRPPAFVAFLIEEPPPEPEPPRPPLWRRLLGGRPLSIQVLAAQLRAVTAEPRVKGVVLSLRPLALDPAQVDELRRLVAEVRATGRRVCCWAPGYTAETYQVACAADEVLLQPGGVVAPLGVARRFLFLADALERVGLRADLLQVSPYKTAGDVVTRSGLTREAREMADWLADAALAEMVAAVGAGRRLDGPAARSLVDGSPYVDEHAVTAGAVDALVAEDDLPARLGGEVRSWAGARRALPAPRPPRPGQVVALLRIEGMILDGRSRRTPFRPPLAPPILFQDQCGDLTVVEQARALAVNRRVGAVVVWVNSGAASASASEPISPAPTALARRKPLVAAMGAVAGSGGYYVTTPAGRVFAHPGTLTGSIGVLAGKLVAAGLFERLLFRHEVVVRGDHAAMWGPDAAFSPAERQKVGELIERSYGLFLRRVAAARGRPLPELEAVAGGRVWTGRQALGHGLVDELGGLQQAVMAARRLAGLPADAPLREVARGRREAIPAPAAAPAALEHAAGVIAALGRAGTWWLSPLVESG